MWRVRRNKNIGDRNAQMTPLVSNELPICLPCAFIELFLMWWCVLSLSSTSRKLTVCFIFLKGLQLHPDRTFHPKPKPLFWKWLLLFTKTYWVALLTSLNAERINWLSSQLYPSEGKFLVLNYELQKKREWTHWSVHSFIFAENMSSLIRGPKFISSAILLWKTLQKVSLS
jgi:hypothetical protein